MAVFALIVTLPILLTSGGLLVLAVRRRWPVSAGAALTVFLLAGWATAQAFLRPGY